MIGVLQRDLVGLYAEQWLGAVDAAHINKCDSICFLGRPLEDVGLGRQANAIYDLVTEATLDGLVVWTTALGSHVDHDVMRQFCRRFDRLPLVSVEQRIGDEPLVLMADRRGMDEAVSHLIEVHGHRRIAFVRGARTHNGAEQRYLGYLDAMARHGLPVAAGLVSEPKPYPAGAFQPMVTAAVERILRDGPLPDAFVTPHDDFAVCILSALAAAGIRTPDEVAVVGFDDRIDLMPGGAVDSSSIPDELYLDEGSPVKPATTGRIDNVNALSLTTVRAPFYELGRRAVEVMAALLRGQTVPAVTEIPTELVVRRSCGCPPLVPADTPAALSASPMAREHLHALIRGALTDRSGQLPRDWPQRLSTALVRGLRGESDTEFLVLMNQFLQLSLWSGERVEHWWRVLFGLRQLVQGVPRDATERARAESLMQYAQTLLNETAERYWRYWQVLSEKRNQIVREVGQQLITAPDLAGLAEVLAGVLPKVGISSCYLAAYELDRPAADEPGTLVTGEVDRDRAHLLLAYQGGADTGTTRDVFPSVRLVPGDELRRPEPYNMVAAPLYFKDQQLGYVLLELGPRVGWIYVALQEQLSTAMHRMFLVERERTARTAVEEAHRRAERHRLAGELHDSVSQALFSMTLLARAAQLALQRQGGDPDSPVAHGLDALRELTQVALAEMRSLIFQMRPEVLHEQGLTQAIRNYTAAIAARDGCDIRVHAGDERLALDERAAEEIFRVTQEAVHNSVKHAGSDHIDVRLYSPEPVDGTLVVEVADDGVGFDLNLPRPGHLGLQTMHERVERIGGRLTIESSPTTSTTVRAVFPGILRQG